MSQLENGSELLEGLGGTQANNLFDAELQRRNLSDSFETEPVRFDGFPLDNDQRGASLRKYDRVVKFVEVAVDGIAPTGGSFTVQLVVNGTLLSQTYGSTGAPALTAVTGNGNGGANPFTTDAPHDPFSGPGVLVSADVPLAVRVTAANGAADARVTIHSRRRVL